MINKIKKKLLVLASTFPRWRDDTNPPFVYELSKRLTNDFDVHVLAPAFPGAKDFEIMDDMKVHRFHYFLKKYEKLAGSGGILPILKKNKLFFIQVPFFIAGEFFALRKLVKKIHPDIIHAHWIIPQGFVAALNKKISGTEYVVTSHGGDIFGLQGYFLKQIKKFTLMNAKKITVVSTAIKNEVHNKIDSNLNVEVIPMGVDSNLFNQNKKDDSIRKKYEIHGLFLLFVGRLAEKKGVRYLIEAMPEIIKKIPNAKLMIIGGGELEEELKLLTKRLSLQNNIIFTGPIPNKDLPKYYATADIFIGPSIIAKGGDTEGFGLTFVEAGMSGCWLIGTNVGGISDIIKNGDNGFVTKEKDSKNLSSNIINSFNSKNKSLEYFKRNFDWNQINEKYIEVLR